MSVDVRAIAKAYLTKVLSEMDKRADKKLWSDRDGTLYTDLCAEDLDGTSFKTIQDNLQADWNHGGIMTSCLSFVLTYAKRLGFQMHSPGGYMADFHVDTSLAKNPPSKAYAWVPFGMPSGRSTATWSCPARAISRSRSTWPTRHGIRWSLGKGGRVAWVPRPDREKDADPQRPRSRRLGRSRPLFRRSPAASPASRRRKIRQPLAQSGRRPGPPGRPQRRRRPLDFSASPVPWGPTPPTTTCRTPSSPAGANARSSGSSADANG